MTRQWTIRPVCFGEFPVFEKSVFTYMRHAGEKIRVPILGFLLQSGDEAILVDTGPSAEDAPATPYHTPIRRSPEQRPDAALRAAGVDPGRITRVVLSHLHWDHCHNLDCFPAARFLVQAEELRTAVNPVPPQRHPYEVGIPGVTPPWMPFFDRLEVVEGEMELAPGVRTVLLPGHTPGLQGVVAETAKGRYLVASDAVPLAANFPGEGEGPLAPAIHVDVAACYRSFERMRAVADVVLPSHDLDVLKHPCYPV
jgi:glyoxylase-like metal-dependent hydrolase (beta-lactamase superfamily II)